MISPERSSEWEYGLGLMSGTSLDGVDLAYCAFRYFSGRWEYNIIKAKTYSYSQDIFTLLTKMSRMEKKRLSEADKILGLHFGKLCRRFIDEYSLTPSFIASHGHTVFHRPAEGYTFQAGCGNEIAKNAGVLCVSDFRSPDVAKGGQGAPLVPIGDKLLFPEYDALINLGGFSNISFYQNGKRTGFDISPVNMALNYFAESLGKPYDEDGKGAASGNIIESLLDELNALNYYSQSPPKSLAREDFEQYYIPVFRRYSENSVNDLLRTFTEHIALQLESVTKDFSKILITGGGIKNLFLQKVLRNKMGSSIVVPDLQLIDYKEAMIFAFMGLLRLKDEINILAEVTGASSDTCSGTIHHP